MADKWKTEQSNLSPQYFAVVGEAGRFVTPFVLSQETATQIVADHNAILNLAKDSEAESTRELVSAIQSATAHAR